MDLPDVVINELIEKQYQSTTSSSDNSSMLNTSTDDNMTSSSERQDEDVLLFPLMRYLMNGRRRHHVENYLQIVDSLTDAEFKEHFRLNRHTVLILIDELEASAFIPLHTFGRKLISAKLSFLLFLWYIANTEPLRTLSDRFGISISSVFRIL